MMSMVMATVRQSLFTYLSVISAVVTSLLAAGINWDLKDMPKQEVCEPAKYGGAPLLLHPCSNLAH